VTWTKISDDFPEDCERVGLSDAAVRTHLEGLVWAMRRENGGRLRHRDLERLADTEDPRAAADELVSVGFWTQYPDGWQIEHQMDLQVEPEVIMVRRKKDAERQRRKRLKAAGVPDPDPDGESASRRDSKRDTPSTDTRDPGLVWAGQDCSGKEVLDVPTSKRDEATSTKPPVLAAVPSPQRPSTAPPLASTDTHGGPSWDLADEMYERS
jgi:hypothetical protein